MHKFTRAHVAALVAVWLLGCGGDSDGADVEQDAGRGDARVTDGGGTTPDGLSGDGGAPGQDASGSRDDAGGSSDGGASGDDAGGSADDGGDDAGPTTCRGTHPMVEGDRRFCGAADCYCPSSDACFAAATARACCGDTVVCRASGDDAGPGCMGTHPMVEGARRFCAPADCYCPSSDACFGATTAATCCEGDVVCAADGGDAGPGCAGTHPIVEGDRRFCAPGDCYCAMTDACFSTATADACCAGDVVCRTP